MGLASPNIEFSKITDTIARTRGGCAMASTIATRMSRSVSVIQPVLDQMVTYGYLECLSGNGVEVYRNIVDGFPVGDIPKVMRPAELILASDEMPDDDTMDRCATVAAAMWRERMGDDRWYDDPRALRERHRQDGLLPPFGAW